MAVAVNNSYRRAKRHESLKNEKQRHKNNVRMRTCEKKNETNKIKNKLDINHKKSK